MTQSVPRTWRGGLAGLGVAALVSLRLCGGEPVQPSDPKAAIPDAQTGSLYPLISATAARSPLELHPRPKCAPPPAPDRMIDKSQRHLAWVHA